MSTADDAAAIRRTLDELHAEVHEAKGAASTVWEYRDMAETEDFREEVETLEAQADDAEERLSRHLDRIADLAGALHE